MSFFFFFFNDTATTEIYTLSLHDALPIFYSAGFITSKEPDYKANTSYFAVSQDMFGDLTSLTLGYRRGWDQVFRDIKTPQGVLENDPTFHQRADHRGYSLSLSQILTRNAILGFNYELLT